MTYLANSLHLKNQPCFLTYLPCALAFGCDNAAQVDDPDDPTFETFCLTFHFSDTPRCIRGDHPAVRVCDKHDVLTILHVLRD